MAPRQKPAEIKNPRRILAVALASAQDHLANVIGRAYAGTTHDLTLDTPYYRAQVPVWLDLVGADEEAAAEANETKETKEKSPYDSDSDGDGDSSPAQAWADAFLADDAREVRAALGGIVAVVDAADAGQRALVGHVGRLARGCVPEDDDEDDGDMPWDGVGLVVGVSATAVDGDAQAAWDDACVAAGLEFVLVAPGQAAANEWGEKTGVARVVEALQANEWGGAAAAADGLDAFEMESFGEFGEFQGGDKDDGDKEDDDEALNFGYDESDFEGLRQAIWQQQTREVGGEKEMEEKEKDDDDDEKEDDDAAVQKLVQKLQAARMQGELLAPAQRRAMAARVVGEVMKEI